MSREQICQQIFILTHYDWNVSIIFYYFILDCIKYPLILKTNFYLIHNQICLIMSKNPFGSLLASRSKDHAKQLKDLFTVIENEQDKEKKHYEEVNIDFDLLFFSSYKLCSFFRRLRIFIKPYLH